MNTKIKNMMYRVAGLALGAVLSFSCVDDLKFGNAFLEKAPGVDVNIDSIFSKRSSAEAFLWTLYGSLNNPYSNAARIGQAPLDALSDIAHEYCTWGKTTATYYAGNVSESIQEPYGYDKFPFLVGGDGNNRNGIWPNIRHGWIFVENIDRVPGLTDEEKSQLKGEALIIMGCRYYDAFKNFGGLPLLDHAYLPDETAPARATVEQTVEFIDGLFLRAIEEPGLKWNVTDQATWAGRVTLGAAYGMRAKLWLFAASPLFNSAAPYRRYEADEKYQDELHSWLGGYKPEYWTKCVEVCEDFFEMNAQNGNYYQLIQPQTADRTGYRTAYREAYWWRGNSEKIIEVHSAYSAGVWDGTADPRGTLYFGCMVPTLEFMEMFGMADGRNYPAEYKAVYNTNNPTNIDIFADRDPRMYETLVVPDPAPRAQFWNVYPTVEFWEGGACFANNTIRGYKKDMYGSGMGTYKWILDNIESNPAPHPLNFAYLRIADMHLVYAEALAQTGDLTGALREVNKVRARVGLAGLETANPSLNLTTNKENLVAEIIRERAVELGFEDTRLYDIIRYKMEDRFSTHLNEIVIWRKDASGGKWVQPAGSTVNDWAKLNPGEPWPAMIYDKRPIAVCARAWWNPGNWDPKFLLSPLTRSEINKGYGLTQNPGW